MKAMLLKAAIMLLYTPSSEHFGIVPLEAMLDGVPVLAANNGGPLETVVDGETGWLRSVDDPVAWSDVIIDVLKRMPREELRRMGERGQDRVKKEFSDTKMANTLAGEINMMIRSPRQEVIELPDILLALGFLGIIATVLYAIVFRVYQHTR